MNDRIYAKGLPNYISKLCPVSHSYSIEEGIQGRIKDPKWMLGMQWRVGEFKVQNGGRPIKTAIKFKTRSIQEIKRKNDPEYTTFDLETPLEMVVESEENNCSNAWNPNRLEYSFDIKGGDVELEAKKYDGNNLDWYNFNLKQDNDLTEEEEEKKFIPTNVSYRGMTDPRWWSIENRKVDIGNIKRPYLNYLTMLLMEFSLLYSNDWYIVPIEHPVGKIRQITSFEVTDSFGHITEVEPVVDRDTNKKGWEIFTLSHSTNEQLNLPSRPHTEVVSKGSFFYLPNNLPEGALESESIEEVSFLRDELANLVWAIEHKYQEPDGTIKNRHDEEPSSTENLMDAPVYYYDKQTSTLVERSAFADTADTEPGNRYIGPLPKYEMMSHVPPHWIPYVVRQIQNPNGEFDGQVILRRSRTQMDTSESQYKGILLQESKYVYEEEVPRVGVIVKRIYQLARDSDGNIYSGLTRKKRSDMRRKSSGLRFDYLHGLK